MKLARLVWTWAALAVLLGATIVVTFLPLGGWRQGISLLIAVAKAALVGLIFMDLRRDGALVRLAALAAVVLLVTLAVMLAADFAFRPAG